MFYVYFSDTIGILKNIADNLSNNHLPDVVLHIKIGKYISLVYVEIEANFSIFQSNDEHKLRYRHDYE